jgi:PAS domain S-box-containing protein
LVGLYAAVLKVGPDLEIRQFTKLAQRAFNLTEGDIGRDLGAISHPLLRPANRKYPKSASPVLLEEVAVEAIESGTQNECEVQGKGGRCYVLQAWPTRTPEDDPDGAVLVLLDVDRIRRRELEAITARNYAEACLRTARDPMVVLHPDLRVNSANEAFYKAFKVSRAQSEGKSLFELNGMKGATPKLRSMLEDIVPRHSFFKDFEVSLHLPMSGKRTMLMDARELEQDDDTSQLILLSITDVSERHRLDERVRLSEIRFRRLFEAGCDGILIVDPVSRKITDANPFIIKLLGRAPSEILGQELWQMGLLQDERSSHYVFRELQQKGIFQNDELQLKTKSGQWRTVEVVANSYEENGAPVIQCVIRDISARKQAEDALRRSEGRYRTLFELGPVAVYSCDRERVIQEFNHRAMEIWGRSPSKGETDEEFCGSLRLFRPDGGLMPLAECTVADVVTGRVPGITDREVQIERPDGSRITVIVNIRPLRNERGEISGAISCLYDISGRKQAEIATASLAAIVESSDDAIISKNLDGIITSWNDSAERLFGYTADEAIGRSVTMLIPADRPNEEPSILRRLKKGERVEHFETVRRRKDGSLMKISLTVSPVRDPSGQVIGASKIARLISAESANGSSP